MNTWLEVAVGLSVVGIAAEIFYAGRIAGELQATVKFEARERRKNEQCATVLLKWLRENREKTRLIELMKRAGRRKREKCRKLKKQASLMQFVAKDLAEVNVILLQNNDAMRNALRDMYVQCSKNTWQQKRIRHILKKHGVIR